MKTNLIKIRTPPTITPHPSFVYTDANDKRIQTKVHFYKGPT